MANFSENFRGVSGPKLCIMCNTHLDSQVMAFRCPAIVPHLRSKGNCENIFGSKLKMETVINIRTIEKMRQEKMKE